VPVATKAQSDPVGVGALDRPAAARASSTSAACWWYQLVIARVQT
jgi:hypothetical protein